VARTRNCHPCRESSPDRPTRSLITVVNGLLRLSLSLVLKPNLRANNSLLLHIRTRYIKLDHAWQPAKMLFYVFYALSLKWKKQYNEITKHLGLMMVASAPLQFSTYNLYGVMINAQNSGTSMCYYTKWIQ